MFNSDFMNPNSFSSYAFSSHQPGTSTAAMSAAAVAATAQNSLAAFNFDAAAANSLMQGAIRAAPNPYRPEIPRGNKRERTKFDAYQLECMETFFNKKPYPDGNDREEMAKQLNLTDVKVQIWFKNRRAKDRNQRHLDDLMAKSRGDFIGGQKPMHSGRDPQSHPPSKKKRRMESPLPDPTLQQQQQQQRQLNGHASKAGESVKQELLDNSSNSLGDYSNNGIIDTAIWDDSQKDLKHFYQAGNYFPFADPTAMFPTPNTNWMAAHSYPPYHFGCFPTNSAASYYHNGVVTPQTAAAAYNDIYASSYPTIPDIKDAKVDLTGTSSSSSEESPSTLDQQQYPKFT